MSGWMGTAVKCILYGLIVALLWLVSVTVQF